MAAHLPPSLALGSKRARSPTDDDDVGIAQPSTDGDDGADSTTSSRPMSSKRKKRRQEAAKEVAGLKKEVTDGALAFVRTIERASASRPEEKHREAMENELIAVAVHWPSGWVQQLGLSADNLSRRLVRSLAVMAAYMSVVEARTALGSRMEGEEREMGPADVKAACEERLGREFEELRRGLAEKEAREAAESEQQIDEGQ